jgi:hypothetical protein
MQKNDYDRYEILKNTDGTINTVPFIKITEADSDLSIEWNPNISRLDKIANKYYSNPFYDFLILLANPQYVDQFDIPQGVTIRIPFPLERAKNEYETQIKKIKEI